MGATELSRRCGCVPHKADLKFSLTETAVPETTAADAGSDAKVTFALCLMDKCMKIPGERTKEAMEVR